MTTNNGWPGKPGVPMNPEEPRYHWVKGCDGENTIVFWRGHGGDTHYENGDLKELDHWSGHPMWIAQDWTYLGLCLTPDEAAALKARAGQAALGHAREADRADRSEFLHKQDVEALQKRVAELKRLVEILVENDPDDMAADAVTVLDVWRKEARTALEGKKE